MGQSNGGFGGSRMGGGMGGNGYGGFSQSYDGNPGMANGGFVRNPPPPGGWGDVQGNPSANPGFVRNPPPPGGWNDNGRGPMGNPGFYPSPVTPDGAPDYQRNPLVPNPPVLPPPSPRGIAGQDSVGNPMVPQGGADPFVPQSFDQYLQSIQNNGTWWR